MMHPSRPLTRSPRPRSAFGWQWCLPILGLALLVRLIWLYAPFTHDPTTLTACMRAMVHGGIREVLATVQDRIHLPWELYLLLVPGWFSQGAAAGAPPTLVEMLALRLSLIFTDVLAVAAVYRIGRKTTAATVALVAAGLYALWPGSIYVDGWWAQTDTWYVTLLLVAAWWLANEKVELAWLALVLAVGVKWQAAMVVPVFLVGTWRWRGWRGLAKGLAVATLLGGVMMVPIILNGQVHEFLVKATVQTLPAFLVEKAHTFWFAALPQGRVMWDSSLDMNPWVGGVSFHDASLVLVAIAQTAIVGRLFWRSGPRVIAPASALAILSTTMFATQISTRHYLAVPALFLLASLFDRKWWGVFGLIVVTQFINLVWESGTLSPLWGLMPVSLDVAVANAWANLAILACALGLYLWPLLARPTHQPSAEGPIRTMRPPLEPALLGVGVLTLIVGAAAYLQRGVELGQPVLSMHAPLVASLQDALHGATPDQIPQERILAINWPWRIEADQPHWLGLLPLTPPALIFDWPYAWTPNVTRVQYPPWQISTPGTSIEYRGDVANPSDLTNLLLQSDRIVSYYPASGEMYLLGERLAGAPSPSCEAVFDQALCLVEAGVAGRAGQLHVDLGWQALGALSPDFTFSIGLTDSEGDAPDLAGADPLGDWLPLDKWLPANGAWHEGEWLRPPPDATSYQVWVDVKSQTSGRSLPVTCRPDAICGPDRVQVYAHGN
jgi:hypothetical protein